MAEVRWCVRERDTGFLVASGSAPTEEDAGREMMHYAVQYGQDGPVSYRMWQSRKTLLQGEMHGVTVEYLNPGSPTGSPNIKFP